MNRLTKLINLGTKNGPVGWNGLCCHNENDLLVGLTIYFISHFGILVVWETSYIGYNFFRTRVDISKTADIS